MGRLKESIFLSTELRVCPQCAMASYVCDGSPLLCRFCGFSCLERRGAKRHISGLEFDLEVGGNIVCARLLDHSVSGLRFSCSHGMNTEDLFSIKINDLGIQKPAKAVWSRPLLHGITVTGLKFSS